MRRHCSDGDGEKKAIIARIREADNEADYRRVRENCVDDAD